MPIYEYLCQKCGHKFEKIQKFSDRLIKKCPECGGPVEQTITAPAVQFKGTGWYVTDYANKDKEKKEKPSSSSKDSSSESTSDKESKADSKESKDSGGKESSSTKESKETKESKPAKSKKR